MQGNFFEVTFLEVLKTVDGYDQAFVRMSACCDEPDDVRRLCVFMTKISENVAAKSKQMNGKYLLAMDFLFIFISLNFCLWKCFFLEEFD